jgi:hypothetical protein
LYNTQLTNKLKAYELEVKSKKVKGPKQGKRAGILQNGVKSGFFVIAGRNRGEMEGESDTYLKKQSQSPGFGRKSEALSSKSETRTLCGAHLKKQGRNKPRGVHIDCGGSNGHNAARLSFSSTKESSGCLAKDFRRQK